MAATKAMPPIPLLRDISTSAPLAQQAQRECADERGAEREHAPEQPLPPRRRRRWRLQRGVAAARAARADARLRRLPVLAAACAQARERGVERIVGAARGRAADREAVRRGAFG